MEAIIVYQSKNGITRKFAEAITRRVQKSVDNVKLKSIEDTTAQDIKNADILYIGAVASGLFKQKPDQGWVDFVSSLPTMEGKQTVLFTTYWLKSGSMLHKMKEYLIPKGFKIIGSMKSNNGNFDYFSIGVLKYSLYRLVNGQVQELKALVSKEEGVLETA